MKPPPRPSAPEWFSLGYCFRFMFREKRLLLWSMLLFLATIGLTASGYQLSIEYVDRFSGSLWAEPPAAESIWGWIKVQGWRAGKVLFFVITRIMAFYLAFLAAYCLTSPGYVFLSTTAERLHAGKDFIPDAGMSVTGVLIDLLEGVKIALFGVLITAVALVVNFIPGLGQGLIFLLYALYSALMFIDYPASRRRWPLGRKIDWIREHSGTALRLGLLPAFVSMIPLLNVFLMSLLFPLLTIHSTLNFSAIERQRPNATAVRSR
jgi:CysZ protein